MIFGQFVAYKDATGDPTRPIVAMLTAIASQASSQWRASNPVPKLNIVMGTVQLTLASKAAISWDTVSAIATKLATLANEGLDGFYSAGTWVQENQVETAAVVAIGLVLAAAAFVPGFLDHLLAGMQEPVDEVA